MTDRRLNGSRAQAPPAATPYGPLAIGGVGGSGTRVGAALLGMLGYDLGPDLNRALDNLWFTLLFKRRSVLLDAEPVIEALVRLFLDRLQGRTRFTADERQRIEQLAAVDRMQHPRDWLRQRAATFLSDAQPHPSSRGWAWKEPNTHIVIEQLFRFNADLRYIHFVRHPLDMALSGNQNQLQLWGPVLLDREVEIGPRDSLAYWCTAHRRMMSIRDQWPGRILFVDFDHICVEPETACRTVMDFIGVEAATDLVQDFVKLVGSGRPDHGRGGSVDLSVFQAHDLEFVSSLGFPPRR